jgi:transcriptional regulator with XRE-family HTH domain
MIFNYLLKVLTVSRPPIEPHGVLGKELHSAIAERGLVPQEVAAAARVHKGTLYAILRGTTQRPHYSTLRRLCKVLQVDIERFLQPEQLELLQEVAITLQESGTLSELEELLVLEIRTFTGEQLAQAAEAALVALMETKVGIGCGPGISLHEEIRSAERHSFTWIEELVSHQLNNLPRASRLAAVQAALGALVDLRIMRGSPLTAAQSARIHKLKARLWRPTELQKISEEKRLLRARYLHRSQKRAS